MITISSHKPDGTTVPCVAEYPSLDAANREAKMAARKNRGYIYIVWIAGVPEVSWSFPRQEVAA